MLTCLGDVLYSCILKKLQERLKMSERDIGLEILEGIQEIKAYKAGEVDLRTRVLTESSSPKEVRVAEQHPEVFVRLA